MLEVRSIIYGIKHKWDQWQNRHCRRKDTCTLNYSTRNYQKLNAQRSTLEEKSHTTLVISSKTLRGLVYMYLEKSNIYSRGRG